MIASRVRTKEDALVYLVECALATVSSMAMLRSKRKSEYQRQIGIAQKGCDWIESMQIIPEEHSLITEIIGKQTVSQWAAKYEPVKSTVS